MTLCNAAHYEKPGEGGHTLAVRFKYKEDRIMAQKKEHNKNHKETTAREAARETTRETAGAARKAASSSARAANDPFSFTTFNGGAGKTMEKLISENKKQMDKFAQDASDFSRDNIEAVIKSSSIFMKGCENIARTAAEMAQSAAERQSQLLKEALSTKTLNEWTEVQNKIAQANFDDFMQGATRMSELGVKVLTESVEPINAQMTKAIKRASESAAA